MLLTQMADEPRTTSEPPPARQEWRVPASPDRVPEVRRGLKGFAEAHGAGAPARSNLALAVTEALTNAVLHAYIGMEPGEVTVTAQAAPGEMLVSVGDRGRGMQPRPDSPGLGMGLPMIGQLTTSVDIRDRPNGGTEVRMRFDAPGVDGPPPPGGPDGRMQLLVEVARLAQAGGWPQQGVGPLVHLLVPAVADACVLERMADDGLQRLASAGAEPARPGVMPEGHEAVVSPALDLEAVSWWIAVPLRDADRPIGLLRLGVARERGEPRPEDLVFLETLAERAARGMATGQLADDLRRTRRRVERVLDILAEAVTVVDVEGRVVYANPAAATLLGAASVQEVLEAGPGELSARFVATREDGTRLADDDWPSRRLLLGLDAPPLLSRSVLRSTGQERWLLTKSTLLDDEGDRLAVSIIEDVTEAKRAELRARFLAHAGSVLGQSLDPEQTLRDVAQLMVPHLSDWCTIDLCQPDGPPRRVAVAHADPERLALAEELEQRYPAYAEGVSPDLAVLLDGGPAMLIPEITAEMLTESALDEEQLRLWRGLGMRSCIVLPMRAREEVIGILTLVTAESARAFDEDDLAFAEDVAGRAAVAVENARLYAGRG